MPLGVDVAALYDHRHQCPHGNLVRLLLKAAKSAPMQQAIAQWLKTVKPRKDVRLSVDIDPQSFL